MKTKTRRCMETHKLQLDPKNMVRAKGRDSGEIGGFKMAKCPACNQNIGFYQLLKHTRRHPIICKNCNKELRLDFVRKIWKTAVLFAVFLAAALAGDRILPQEYLAFKTALYVIALSILIWLAFKQILFLKNPDFK